MRNRHNSFMRLPCSFRRMSKMGIGPGLWDARALRLNRLDIFLPRFRRKSLHANWSTLKPSS
jgi:hypothetical protein